MRDFSLRSGASALLTAVCLLGTACGDDSTPPAADETGGTTGNVDGTTASSVSATSQGSLTSGVDSTGGTGSETTGGMTSAGFLPGDSSDGGPAELPNGEQCDDNSQCASEFCYQIPMLGGICSDCLSDEDCKEGTCSLDPMAFYAVCTDGSAGVMCSSDEGCMGDLVCAELINTGGLFPLDFCSECRDDVPCPMGQVCSPVYDLEALGGYLGCVDPGTVPNGGGCPVDGIMGDGTVCQSGLCGIATLGGIIPVGVCGECLDDMDCMGMSTCEPPSADMTGLQGATCI